MTGIITLSVVMLAKPEIRVFRISFIKGVILKTLYYVNVKGHKTKSSELLQSLLADRTGLSQFCEGRLEPVPTILWG